MRDGIHELIVQTRVPACGGLLSRYGRYAFAPVQRFDPGLSDYAVSRVPKPGEPVELILTPRDRAGNLLGPSRIDSISVSVDRDGVAAGMVDRQDGSYLVRIARSRPTTLAVSVRIGDVSHTAQLPRSFYWMHLTQPIVRLIKRVIAWWRVRSTVRRWRSATAEDGPDPSRAR